MEEASEKVEVETKPRERADRVRELIRPASTIYKLVRAFFRTPATFQHVEYSHGRRVCFREIVLDPAGEKRTSAACPSTLSPPLLLSFPAEKDEMIERSMISPTTTLPKTPPTFIGKISVKHNQNKGRRERVSFSFRRRRSRTSSYAAEMKSKRTWTRARAPGPPNSESRKEQQQQQGERGNENGKGLGERKGSQSTDPRLEKRPLRGGSQGYEEGKQAGAVN